MLKCLYMLSQRYKDKKIIVYGVSRTSINLFTDLVLNHKVNIHAFWDADDKFTGEYFVNRNIINTAQLRSINNAIIIIPEVCKKQEIQKCAGQGIEVFYKDEVLEVNEEMNNKRIYIYGIDKRGENIYDTLKENGIEPCGACVTKLGRVNRWYGKEILSIEKIKHESNCSVILATDNWITLENMLEKLVDLKIEKYIPFFRKDYAGGNFFQIINIALLQHNKIWLYNNGDENAQYLKEILKKYQIDINQEIYGKDIYKLVHEDIKHITVIVAEKNVYESERVCDVLDSLGFSLEKLNYTAIICCTYKPYAYYKETKSDSLLVSNSYATERYPGYVVYGDEKYAKVKIMIVGNSTSTSNIYRIVSWVNFLYERMREAGYSPIIYNGAVGGYGIVDEFLHMMRDIEPLRPDYVISFSGINNTINEKAANQFNIEFGKRRLKYDNDMISGIKSSEKLYDFWCRISKVMKLVAEYHGAKVYSFLQPMISIDETVDLVSTSIFNNTEKSKNVGAYKSRALMETDRFYINLASMLEGKKDMYIDECHYSVEANKLIAEHVFNAMKQDIEETVKHKIQNEQEDKNECSIYRR